MVKIFASIGEVLDKISILEIKSEHIVDAGKLNNIKKELDLLIESVKQFRIPDLESDLKSVNKELWDIEDRIRIKECNKEFDDEFIQLARLVYLTNDKRSEIKRKINELSKSELTEEKSYSKYK